VWRSPSSTSQGSDRVSASLDQQFRGLPLPWLIRGFSGDTDRETHSPKQEVGAALVHRPRSEGGLACIVPRCQCECVQDPVGVTLAHSIDQAGRSAVTLIRNWDTCCLGTAPGGLWRSDWLDRDAGRMGGQGPQVSEVAGQDRAAGFGNRYDQRVYCGPGPRCGAQPGRPAGEPDGNALGDVAGPKEAVLRGIT
jgi:hypothetical protein